MYITPCIAVPRYARLVPDIAAPRGIRYSSTMTSQSIRYASTDQHTLCQYQYALWQYEHTLWQYRTSGSMRYGSTSIRYVSTGHRAACAMAVRHLHEASEALVQGMAPPPYKLVPPYPMSVPHIA
eukprot:815555-Rhodomonas_salina.8